MRTPEELERDTRYLRVDNDTPPDPTPWEPADIDDDIRAKIREAYVAGGMPAAVRVAADLALCDLEQSHAKAKAVEAQVLTWIERQNPDMKHERVTRELASMGLGKKHLRKFYSAKMLEAQATLEAIRESSRRAN